MSRRDLARDLAFASLVLLAALMGPRVAWAQAGWKTEVVGKKAVLTPPDLGPSEFYQVTVYPSAALAGASLADFVDGVAARETAALGKESVAPIPAQAKNPNTATTTHTFVTPQGQTRVAVYTALSLDGDNARVISVVLSDLPVFRRYQPQMQAVVTEAVRQEKAAGESATPLRGAVLGGMTLGGKIVPGIYAGNCVDTYDGKIVSRIRLYLYTSGECRLCNEKGEDYRFGADTYSYDMVTGKLDVGQQYDLYNSVLGSDDAYSLYGHGSDGMPYLQANSDHGFGRMKTLLRYVGPTDRPSPKQAEAAKAAAEAEAKRYKFVTAPGKGVQAAQIAGILHQQTFRFGRGDAKNDVYLLLKDGTVHDGLPVPPDEMDVSLSRRREPERWGRWRRQGTQYAAEWSDQPNRFEPLKGEPALPARTAEQLAGRFGAGSNSGSMMTGGSYHLWGVTFTPGARFLKDNSGGASSGSLGQTLNDFSANTTYDDSGSYTSATSPSAVVGSGRKTPGGHRGGTYSLSGYVLTLRYDDGRVERTPFFFTSAKRDEIYFEGASLAFDDHK